MTHFQILICLDLCAHVGLRICSGNVLESSSPPGSYRFENKLQTFIPLGHQNEKPLKSFLILAPPSFKLTRHPESTAGAPVIFSIAPLDCRCVRRSGNGGTVGRTTTAFACAWPEPCPSPHPPPGSASTASNRPQLCEQGCEYSIAAASENGLKLSVEYG